MDEPIEECCPARNSSPARSSRLPFNKRDGVISTATLSILSLCMLLLTACGGNTSAQANAEYRACRSSHGIHRQRWWYGLRVKLHAIECGGECAWHILLLSGCGNSAGIGGDGDTLRNVYTQRHLQLRHCFGQRFSLGEPSYSGCHLELAGSCDCWHSAHLHATECDR